MTKLEVDELVNLIDMNYRGFIKEPILFSKKWYEYLYQYSFEEVENKLHECMSMEQFQYQPPTLDYLIKDLTKIQDRVDLSKMIVYCQFCKRIFNSINELHIHENRCRSVRYIARQYQKYFNREVNKRELYEMDNEEFNEKYDILLKYVEKHISDEKEKKIINFIFNLPGKETAKKFINS